MNGSGFSLGNGMVEAPPVISSGESQRSPYFFSRLVVAAVFVAVMGGLLVLYFFNPQTAGFYPVCAFHEITGLDCPGCGTLRALHQLTHGHLAAAWRLNAFFVAMLPVALWLGAREAVRWTTGWRWPGIVTGPVFVWSIAIGIVVWGVVRNLPIWR